MSLDDAYDEQAKEHIKLKMQAHYTDTGIQPIEYMMKSFSPAEFEGFLKGNVIKYLGRYQRKDGIKDLKKAKVYQDWLIEYKETGGVVL